MSIACQHGQLARQCQLCEKDAEIATLRARVAELEEKLNVRAQEIDAWQQRYMELLDTVAATRTSVPSTAILLPKGPEES